MIKLSEISTKAPEGTDEEKIRDATKDIVKDIADLQYKLYAEKKQSMIVVFQGMDSSGKDGATSKVFRSCGPIGVNVFSFKKPTEKEFAHDFLWRVHQVAPEDGMIHVFNRSHYEDILIQRVHNWIDMETVHSRMRAINGFEQMLFEQNDTKILKFYLHLSKERQEEKLRERVELLRKHWKHNDNDWNEREHWDSYMEAYEYAINESEIPWHIVPVDQRWYRNYAIAKIVLEELKAMDPQFPELDSERF